MLHITSQMAGPPVYTFKRLPLTFPGKSFSFTFTNYAVPQSVISLITYGPSQCILIFPRNLSNLLSYNNTKSFSLKVCSLICQSCQAFSHYFCTCWWNPANNHSSSSSSNYASLSSKAPRSIIPVSATMRRLGMMYSIGIIASTPFVGLRGPDPCSELFSQTNPYTTGPFDISLRSAD